jgi:hypothetical protein
MLAQPGLVPGPVASNTSLSRKALRELVGNQTGTWLSLSHIYELAPAYEPSQLGLGRSTSKPGPAPFLGVVEAKGP